MSTPHTPGPWEVVEVPYTGLIGVRRGTRVLNLSARLEGDANLIAAAPELLAALRAARIYVRDAYECAFPRESENVAVLQAIDAAIAKATGSEL